LINALGLPLRSITLRLKSSPNTLEAILNASSKVDASMDSFFSPEPLFKTEGITNSTVANL
jgi:hypothetical protein